jgi:hypothetical protein
MSNKKKMAIRLWLAFFLVLAVFSVSHADYVISNVPEIFQEHRNWSWAASSRSILNYYDRDATQCAIANYSFSRSDCCGNSTFYWSHSCNSDNYLCADRGMDEVLINFGPVNSSCRAYPMSEWTVQFDTDAHRPFVMKWDWAGGGSHTLVGRGYMDSFVHYVDPWPGNGYTVSRYTYVKESYSHRWTSSLRILTPGEAILYDPYGTITDTTPTYRWQKAPDATWYRLYVHSLSSDTVVFDDWLSSTDYSCSGNTCTYTPSTALASGNYRWWVKTFSSYGYGPWSNPGNFTVDAGCINPGKVTLISPSGVISTHSPTYRWNEDGPSTWYRLYVYNDTDDKTVVNEWVTESSVCSGGACSYDPGIAVEMDNHKWWIQTWNSCGSYGPWSDPLSFKYGKPDKATLLSPQGTTYTRLPSYKWKAVPSATWYGLYVWDYSSDEEILYKWYRAPEVGCSFGTGDCTITPDVSLNDGSHGWWIRAYNGLYGDWSGPLRFNVVPYSCGFNEQFNSGNATNWTRHRSSWKVVSDAWYYTSGLSDKWASTTYNATHSNADYEARLWRGGTSSFSNTLLVRSSGVILSDNVPANCYMFQYRSDGYYSVWKRVNGAYQALKSWTYSSYINKGAAWNTLRAWVNGSSLYLNVNGHWIWSASDSSLSSGAFGLSMYRGSGGSLYVDWATLTCLSGAAEGDPMGDFEISPEQQKLNEAVDVENQIRDVTDIQN